MALLDRIRQIDINIAGPALFLAGCLLLLFAWWIVRKPRTPKESAPPKLRRGLLRGLFACVSILVALPTIALGGYILWFTHRSLPAEETRQLAPGVEFRRVCFSTPRPMVMSILTIDMQTPGFAIMVTPPSLPDNKLPARTTSEFLTEFKAVAAINANGFPYVFHAPWDYSPHAGDAISPSGFAAARGVIYGKPVPQDDWANYGTLYMSADNKVTTEEPKEGVFNAVSGTGSLVRHGKRLSGDSEVTALSAMGYDKTGRYIYFVTVDGKQPHYSEGIAKQEFGELLPKVIPGIEAAIVLDGGGSTTLAAQDPAGNPVVLNSPMNIGIVGKERAVVNHVGIVINNKR